MNKLDRIREIVETTHTVKGNDADWFRGILREIKAILDEEECCNKYCLYCSNGVMHEKCRFFHQRRCSTQGHKTHCQKCGNEHAGDECNTEEKKPSERIREKASKNIDDIRDCKKQGITLSVDHPEAYIPAILDYLDENHENRTQ